MVFAVILFGLWVTHRSAPQILINDGYLAAAIGLGLFGAYSFITGWDLKVDERDALVASVRQVGFPVGHASAQMGWRGVLSRPTWRILLYSAEDPPTQRGLVLVDGVDGEVLEWFVEDNPEDWSTSTTRTSWPPLGAGIGCPVGLGGGQQADPQQGQARPTRRHQGPVTVGDRLLEDRHPQQHADGQGGGVAGGHGRRQEAGLERRLLEGEPATADRIRA